jgi:lipopolysaccharide transport system ATP-binding protein
MSVILEAKNVTLEYKTRTGFLKNFTHRAVDNVSFTIEAGEVFGVLGRNGSGKSSLLSLLSGIFQPDSGQVIVPKGVSRSLLTLGLGFNPMLSGRDNALLSCMIDGFSRKQSESRLEDIKVFSDLGDFYEQPVKTYSAGMRARLGFSTAVLTDVDILLIDETLSVGDKNFRDKAEQAILDKLDGSQTVVFVSHSEAQVQKLCGRAIWLEKGVIKSIGDSGKVVADYLS